MVVLLARVQRDFGGGGKSSNSWETRRRTRHKKTPSNYDFGGAGDLVVIPETSTRGSCVLCGSNLKGADVGSNVAWTFVIDCLKRRSLVPRTYHTTIAGCHSHGAEQRGGPNVAVMATTSTAAPRLDPRRSPWQRRMKQ